MKTKKGWDGLSNQSETKNPKKEERKWLKLKNRVGWKDAKGGLSERRGEVREGKEKKKARVEKGVKKRVVEGVSRPPSPFCGV